MEPEKDIFEEWKESRENRLFYKRWFRSIVLWWEFNGSHVLDNIKKGLENIWYWLPVIWKDRHWDHSCIFHILEHKLKAQAHRLHTADLHFSARRDAEIIKTGVRLIDKVDNEFYSMEPMNYYKDKHWFEPVEGNHDLKRWKARRLEQNFDEYFAKYPLTYKRVLRGEGPYKVDDKKDKDQIARAIGYYNHQRARKLLFKIMEQNIEKWWD